MMTNNVDPDQTASEGVYTVDYFLPFTLHLLASLLLAKTTLLEF